MSWNYRVCRTTEQDGSILYHIREVYYDAQGQPNDYCGASVDNWESIDDLRETLRHMLGACDRPVIEEQEL